MQSLVDLQGKAWVSIVRDGNGFLITPSRKSEERASVHEMVWMGFDGRIQGGREPSSEWRSHHEKMGTRCDIHAVVHTDSRFAKRYSACDVTCH